jgi:uncharacterized membrane protein HdeD (DUF308 family)
MEAEVERRVGRGKALAWGGTVALGAAIVLCGIFALGSPAIASLTTILVLGALLVAAGAVEIAAAFRFRAERRFWTVLLAGALSLLVGVVLLVRPGPGLAASTALLGAYFLAGGAFRAITSVVDRYTQWRWDFLAGLVAVALGALVLSTWPVSSLWLLGTMVGVELLARGFAWIAAGFGLRRILRSGGGEASLHLA